MSPSVIAHNIQNIKVYQKIDKNKTFLNIIDVTSSLLIIIYPFLKLPLFYDLKLLNRTYISNTVILGIRGILNGEVLLIKTIYNGLILYVGIILYIKNLTVKIIYNIIVSFLEATSIGVILAEEVTFNEASSDSWVASLILISTILFSYTIDSLVLIYYWYRDQKISKTPPVYGEIIIKVPKLQEANHGETKHIFGRIDTT